MSIPENIKTITRPKSTVVKNINGSYYVYHRTSIIKNGKHYPKEDGCVGKIINGAFVSNATYINKQPASFLDYGNIAFIIEITKDLLNELKLIFNNEESEKILVIATMRVLYDQVLDHASDYYFESYLHVYFKNLNLSEKPLSEFIRQLGLHYGKIMEFTQKRANKTNNHILIDGTLKNNESKTNTYSAFSRKSRIKNYEDISLIYAYDVEKCEPIGAKVFPGNVLDKTSFIQTVKDFGIKRGLIIGDRGYISENNIVELDKIHIKYLLPLPSNAVRIKENIYGKILDTVFKNGEDMISGLKVKIGPKKYLYAYRNEDIKSFDSKVYMKKIADKINGYTIENYEKQKESFGLIVFYSNYNSDLEKVYSYYEERWDVECMFRCYKSTLSSTVVSAHKDQSLIGTEFINLISVIIECKIKKMMKQHNLYNKYSVKYFLEILKRLKIYTMTPEDNSTWTLSKLTKQNEELYAALGITKPSLKPII